MRKYQIISLILLAALLLSACGGTTPPIDTGEETEEPVIIGTVTPDQPIEAEAQSDDTPVDEAPEAGEEISSVEEESVEPGPLPTPTAAPALGAFPLEADLFYLSETGQVWKQPLTGDESAAASVTRQDLVIMDFVVAPGGGWILYRTDDVIGMTALDGTTGQLLDNGVGLPVESETGRTLGWSPDASKIAYTTDTGFRLYIPGAGVEFGPLVFDAPEEPLMDIGWSENSEWLLTWRADGVAVLYRSDPILSLWVELGPIHGYHWLSDGRLAFAPEDGGLALVDPLDLGSRAFMVATDQIVSLPGENADGSLWFFIHSNGIGGPGFLNIGDPTELSFRQESSLPVFTQGLSWSPKGGFLVGKAGNSDAETGISIVDPLTGSEAIIDASGQPGRFAWGDLPPQSVDSLPLPTDLYFLAPLNNVIQLWRLPANGDPPEPLTQAVAPVTAYAISPDGTELVYTSEGIIYRTEVGDSNVSQVIGLSLEAGTQGGTLSYSPDGTQLTYANEGIWTIDLVSSELTRLVADSKPSEEDARLIQVYSHPQWSPDGDWILAQVNFYEGYDFVLLSTQNRPSTPVELGLFVARARWLNDGNLLVFNEGGVYGEPALTLVEPGALPDFEARNTRLLDLPVIDARVQDDGRIGMLGRLSPAYTVGPTSVRIYSLPSDFAIDEETGVADDLRVETGAIVIDRPLLSMDGRLVAGLFQANFDIFGSFTGRIAIVNPATGQVFVIAGIENVSNMQWGP